MKKLAGTIWFVALMLLVVGCTDTVGPTEVAPGFGDLTADVIDAMDAQGMDGAAVIAALEAGDTNAVTKACQVKRVQVGYENVDGAPMFATVGNDCGDQYTACIIAAFNWYPSNLSWTRWYSMQRDVHQHGAGEHRQLLCPDP